MPILNLSKGKKEEGKEESKEEVPDELPSLPEEEKKEEAIEESKEEKTEAGEEKKEEAPEEKKESTEELAPDELPPVENKSEPVEGEQEETQEAPKEILKPKVLDERLYFSKLIKKLNDGAPIEDIEKELRSKDVISTLKHNIDVNKKDDSKSEMQEEIKKMISDLQILEREWSSLKLDIDDKQKQFKETEKKIKDDSETIKKKFSELDGLRTHY
jgi:hypothetical protein